MSADFDSSCRPEEHPRAGAVPPIDDECCRRAADIFRTLGDPARLKLLILLSRGPQCVSALADATAEGLPAVSQRLKLLRGERIVRARREGKHVFYSLLDQHIADLIAAGLAHAME